MQQVETDVLKLTRDLLLENKRRHLTKGYMHFDRFIHTDLQILLADLAYFLEVELWQGMEPVGQLSEVENFHLKPKVESHVGVNGEA